MKIGARNKSNAELVMKVGARNKPVKIGTRYRGIRDVKKNNMFLQKMLMDK